ncbi:MAG TPA: alpha/beta hydrolase [Candidatus Acidoferrum sp.]|nr:alpha/beta hydrolase [Candidatus Acidoferrum sp.]
MNFLFVLLVGYVVALGVLRLFESHLIYFPNDPGRLDGDWHPSGLPVEDLWLRASDGVKLHAWWIPADGATFTFVAFHGNAGNISHRADVYRFLRETPANVLAVEYRGYGRSDGAPSEAGLYRDADAAYQYLVRTRGIAPRTVISFGQSLGTAVASHLAANSEVGGVVLEAPFPSISAVARRVFWFLPGVQFVVAGQFPTSRHLARINAPLLLAHCEQDPVIPPPLEEQVYEEANPPKYVLRVEGPCHEEASLFAPTRYRASLHSFLAAVSSTESHN